MNSEQAIAIALQYHQAGKLAEAELIYRQILRTQPQNLDALHLSGVVAAQMGRSQEAIHLISQAITINPTIPAFYLHLGNALQVAGRFQEAITHYRTALNLDPDDCDTYNNLGACLHELEQFAEAERYYRLSLKLKPDNPETYNNLGSLLTETNRDQDAIVCFQKALQLNPNLAGAYVGLGNLLRRQGHANAEAITHYQQALQLNPHLDAAYVGLGNLLGESGVSASAVADSETSAIAKGFNAALSYYEQALKLNPHNAYAHFQKSLSFLRLGNFAQGWREFIWRKYIKNPNRTHDPVHFKIEQEHIPRLPLSLSGQRIFLKKEQGLGDELFFLRFAPLLKARGAWLAYYPGKKIATILSRQTCLDQLLMTEDELTVTTDYTLMIGDLPLALQMESIQQIPPSLHFSVLPEQVNAINQRLAQLGPRPYLAVTWQGGAKPEENTWRRRILYKEISLPDLANALRPIDATILVLQRNPRPEELTTFSQLLERPIHDLSALNDDLEKMLALLSLVDDYVGVSNTNMHLLAGLGKTAKVLIPYPPDWRWMAEGDESPWFKGFKTYRQLTNGDWSLALQRLTRDLKNR